MFFGHLPKEIQDVIKTFPKDEEFSEMLNNDAILDKLDEEATHNVDDFNELCAMLEGVIYVNGKKYKALTPRAWAYLFNTKSPLVQQSEEAPSELDFDNFAYVIENGAKDVSPEKNLLNAGYCRSIGMTEEDVIDYYKKQMELAFAPLKMFPQTIQNEDNVVVKELPHYDVDWLTALISKVHEVTGELPSKIMDMALNTCSYYFVQYARAQGEKNISRRTSEEVMVAKIERTIEIIVEALIKKGVIDESERQEYFDKINVKE